MRRTAQALALAAAAALAGCFNGLDDGPLINGSAPPNGPAIVPTLDGGGPGSADGASPPHPSTCDDFSSDAPGANVAGWSFDGGRWAVMSTGAAHALVQLGTNMNRAYAIYGQGNWSDYTVSVTLVPTQTGDSDCLDARWQDEDDHYSLCLRDGDGWNVSKYHGNQRVQLAGGDASYAPGEAHVLGLALRGDTLTPIVDGNELGAISDGQLDHGSVGVSTMNPLTIAKLCVTLE
jgi:hypothetical protein